MTNYLQNQYNLMNKNHYDNLLNYIILPLQILSLILILVILLHRQHLMFHLVVMESLLDRILNASSYN